MFVMFSNWLETSRLLLGLVGVGVLGPLVMSFNGCSGTYIVCRASIVAEGGVFSPSSGLGGGLVEGLNVGVSFSRSREVGVGVDERSNGDDMSSLEFCRLNDDAILAEAGLSGERSGDLLSR